MPKLVGIAGSLRAASYNAGLLRAAVALAPKDLVIDVATIRGIPIYDADEEEKNGIPDVVAALKDRIAAADGLLIASPEYNQSIPGPMKNAIDWLSRPPKDMARIFTGMPVGLIGTSPGRLGTAMAQTAWLPVFRALAVVPFLGASLYVSGARSLFDEHGELTDDATKKLLASYLEKFSDFVVSKPRPKGG